MPRKAMQSFITRVDVNKRASKMDTGFTRGSVSLSRGRVRHITPSKNGQSKIVILNNLLLVACPGLSFKFEGMCLI